MIIIFGTDKFQNVRETAVNISVSNPPSRSFASEGFRGRGRGSFRGRGGSRGGPGGGGKRDGGESGGAAEKKEVAPVASKAVGSEK